MTSPQDRPLPVPGTREFEDLRLGRAEREIYAYLYERRDDPPTMVEITQHVETLTGVPASQIGRRKRELHKRFEVALVGSGKNTRHRLVGWARIVNPDAHLISQKARAIVLAPARCARCGRTVADDHVKLVVDHVIPQRWGGTSELSNLQPLCEDCNAGKKDYYGDFEQYADQIRESVNHDEPHRRIAMLLQAFHGEWVPSELLGAVASAKQYQEDWQKRTRELRYLGWAIDPGGGRRGAAGQDLLPRDRDAPLPEGSIARPRAGSSGTAPGRKSAPADGAAG